ncbi:MAG: N-acylneuraminate cytidylyltransferase [Parcubacteria group bacterium Gr01-1014_33]|nr:MAG: N-acylneuraminate cytidylyltransferase [Parcubacteria group bacterium Gr01-1014_33]
MTHILAIIPARGGSKSIPKKSIVPCAGLPLLSYTIRAAQGAKLITRLIISTDDEEMANVARSEGVEVPFMRPGELALDDTPDLPVFEHALQWLKEKEGHIPDAVVHLRPTSPLKSTADIDRGIQLLLDHPDAHSVRSVCKTPYSPFKMYKVGVDGYLESFLIKEFPEVFEKYREPHNMPNQLLPSMMFPFGHIDVIRTDTIAVQHSMSGTRILPLFFEAWRSVDIDSSRDLTYAEIIINELRVKGKEPWES